MQVLKNLKPSCLVCRLQLFGGGGGGGSGGAEDTFSINRIAEGVSSWWSALDPSQLVAEVSSSGQPAGSTTEVPSPFGCKAQY